MNILIIGNGAREYSIGRRLRQDGNVRKIYFSPGNGATSYLGENLNISDFNHLADFVENNEIDFTIVGPEAALSAGIVDVFESRNLTIFGPSKQAAKLESSKVFMKNFLKKYQIKTARYLSSGNYEELSKFIDGFDNKKIVVKADGLCAGKGVIITNSCVEAKEAVKQMLSGESFGDAGKQVVVEEFLDGFELSFFAICDGHGFVSLPVAQDHKRLLDNDMGPNTGGMGAYAPSPLASKELILKIEKEIIEKTLSGMVAEGCPFKGVLFVGIMVVNNTPYVLEFNVRFGDPECEVIMPLIKSNLSEILYKAATGELTDIQIEDKFAVGVVVASRDYPYKSSPKTKINIGTIQSHGHISYAGVESIGEDLYASGGRVLVCVGVDKDLRTARDFAYNLCENINFDGMQFRKDIAYQALKNAD